MKKIIMITAVTACMLASSVFAATSYKQQRLFLNTMTSGSGVKLEVNAGLPESGRVTNLAKLLGAIGIANVKTDKVSNGFNVASFTAAETHRKVICALQNDRLLSCVSPSISGL
jgi:hypothetical protein